MKLLYREVEDPAMLNVKILAIIYDNQILHNFCTIMSKTFEFPIKFAAEKHRF